MPRVVNGDRFTINLEAPNFWRVDAKYGFMETPDVPNLRESWALARNWSDRRHLDVGRASVVALKDGQGLPSMAMRPFTAISRNSARMSDYLKVQNDRLVKIGRKIPV